MSKLGTVKRFDRKRGFGFIKPKAGGKDLFIHWNDIVSEDKWPALKRDMEIKYDTKISEKDGKEVACNVTDASGGAVSMGDASEHKLSTFTVKGTVKFFARKGFGFITTASKVTWPKKLPAGSDIHVSRENLICAEGSVCTLRKDTKVAFKVFAQEGQDTLSAAEVTDEEGNPLNYEAREPGERKPMKRFKGKKGKGKGKGEKSKGTGKGVKKVISKFAKATAQKLNKKPKGKDGGGDGGEGRIVKMGKHQKSSKGGGKGEGKVKMAKGRSKGKSGGKGVKKPQFQKTKIVYVEVPVYKNGKNSKGGGKGGKQSSKGGGKGGKSKGGWQLVPKKKTKAKQEFW